MSFSLKSFREIAETEDLTKLNEIVHETNLCAKGQQRVSEEYAEALAEILEIIEHTNKQTAKKLSDKLMAFFKHNASSNYVEKFDYQIELQDNLLSPKTRDLITMIYRNYLCTQKEKDIFDEILRQNMDKPKNSNTTVPLFNTTNEDNNVPEKKINSLIESEEYLEGTIDKQVVSTIISEEEKEDVSEIASNIEETDSVNEEEQPEKSLDEDEEQKVVQLPRKEEMDIKDLSKRVMLEYSLDEEFDEELEEDYEFNYYVNFRDSQLEKKLDSLNNTNKKLK